MTPPPVPPLAQPPAVRRAVAALERTNRAIINENPVALVFRRTERLPAEGAWVIQRREHGPYTVRVYQESAQALQPVQDTLPAERRDQSQFSLLAGPEADLCGDPDVFDELTVEGLGLLRLTVVLPLVYAGVTFGFRARADVLRPAAADGFPNPLIRPLPPLPADGLAAPAPAPWSRN